MEKLKEARYDFSMADKPDNAMTYGVIARTIVLDRMVEQYLKKYEKCSCYKSCMWTGYQMLPYEGKISALVQCRFAGDYEDKAAVSSGNGSDMQKLQKICNG